MDVVDTFVQSGVLTREKILEYMERPLPERLFISPLIDPKQVGACSVDLRLGLDFKVARKSRMQSLELLGERQDVEAAIRKYQESIKLNLGDSFILHPQMVVLANTLEYVRLPNDLMSQLVGRYSWSRLAVHPNPGIMFPGYSGTVTLTLVNQGDTPIVFRPGYRIVQLVLHKVWGQVTHKSRYTYGTEAEFSRIHLDDDLQMFGPQIQPVVIGIVSTVCSGRTEAIKHLVGERGFKHYSLTEFVRREARNRGLDPTRHRLQEVGNSMRELYGADYFAKEMVRRLADSARHIQYVVLDGIKHPGEVSELRDRLHFHLLGIDAPLEVRFKRAAIRRRPDDPKTLEDFTLLDEIDRGIVGDENSQQVDKLLDQADDLLMNDSNELADLFEKLDKAERKLLGIQDI